MLALWSTLPYPGATNTGRNQLAYLAKLLLSVVANSAGAERLFSRMGHIHSKRRNRMHYDKVHDLATVAMDLEEQHRAAGLVRKRARRRFDTAAAQPTSSLPQAANVSDAEPDEVAEALGDDEADNVDDEAPVDFKTLADRLRGVADDDEDDPTDLEEDGDLPTPADFATPQAHQPRVRLFFGTARPMSLREVFNFSNAVEGVEDGLGIFWKGGMLNLDKERSVYETVFAQNVPDLSDDEYTYVI